MARRKKTTALLKVAEDLLAHKSEIISANEIDVENGRKNHMPEALVDRLMLTDSRLTA